MTFVSATVDAGSVAATLTDYPTYVDLSRTGISTIAEANSVRVYLDEEKTTEIPREIVNVSEMHALIPSLTTTTTIYIDYDGIRSDYATTDTYGAEAVWVNYISVLHMDEASGNLFNSAGNGDQTVTGSPTYGTAGQIGDSITWNGINQYAKGTPTGYTSTTPFSIQSWIKRDSSATFRCIACLDNDSNHQHYILLDSSHKIRVSSLISGVGRIISTATIPNATWTSVAGVWASSSSRTGYINGSSFGTNTTTKTPTAPNSYNVAIRDDDQWFDGGLDEHRYCALALSSDWISTEYNNQSDESNFWGTWTEIGGGPTESFTPIVSMIS